MIAICFCVLSFLYIYPIFCDAVYTDQFVIRVAGGEDVAKKLADKHGFRYLGQVIEDFYRLQHRKVAKRSYNPSYQHHILLQQEPQVKWYSQQIAKKRVKRDIPRKHDLSSSNLNDPRWPQMWYLNRGQGLDMNVQNAWLKGITGNGTVVTILDDGLEKDHPDIASNYDPKASYDVNNHDADPEPRYDFLNSNRHGTRCAGEVAANANNSICAVGIAFNAGIGGVKMLDGDVTDAVEAQSLSLNPQHIDIYSASWGPDDDGKTVDGPGDLATKAFLNGIEKGRNGLGSIFVWASGNGGRESDNCNCDGYTNSIWTLSISSATENGLVPWYSEACSSTLATTYSSGSAGEKQIVTTDLHHECTSSHTGTSASAPLAAGICALTLEANKHLTWRDMQHIVVRTAQPANLFSKDWSVNGVGRNVSHSFGYGMMDAAAMVNLAQNWITAPPQKLCEVRAHMDEKKIHPKSHITVSLEVHCENVRYLEHVQAKISMSADRRGDIYIFLTSPMGTRSRLLDKRPKDMSRSGFQSWPFMTVHNWGENPNGMWKLDIHNDGRDSHWAVLKKWSLLLYGTTEDPDNHQSSSSVSRSMPMITDHTTPASLPSERNSAEKVSQQTKDPYYHASDKEKPLPNSQDSLKSGTANSIRCAHYQDSALCIDCPKGKFIYNRECVAACPESYINISIKYDVAKCVPCHYTCHSCKGPNDYQCLTCHSDSVLSSDNYCQPKSVVREILSLQNWYIALTLTFIIFCILILLAFAYLCFYHSLFCKNTTEYIGLQKTEAAVLMDYDSEDG